MSLKIEDVEKTVQWEGESHIVYVKSKNDYMKVRNGSPTSEFWTLWRKHKDELKSFGFSVKKEENEEEGTSEWRVNYWTDANDHDKEEAKKNWDIRQRRINGEEK
jgi:hypothetical protein